MPLEKESFAFSSSGFILYRSSRQGICTANFYPKLTMAYTVRTELFECPAVLLFPPCTSGARRSSALQGTETAAVWLFGLRQVWFWHFQGSGTRRTERTPIDGDAKCRNQTAGGMYSLVNLWYCFIVILPYRRCPIPAAFLISHSRLNSRNK